ncbi:LacI family DNA-binding transcriptional regulator [Caulobacter sp. 602-2]|uniref:LacI family DNA-binding transcriptional regulator n=1 Tax=Caulobacter sp. 602-2 TaxID=2710887 RepID=A0A6G4QW79_9CAUL|nr:LacI family DNA-binding transcriptional regulator [Caulobacter sp. 602-2]NGM49198.1 LacI family DNA-binding transcriptional regulator [Caulobacter sp. 602-2]
MRNVTIVHVAEKARVSVKTVSRVVNNEPTVTPELRERVQAAIDQLGYAPNIAARRLGGSRSFLIVAFNDRKLTLENWRSDRGNNWIDRMQYGAMLRCDVHGYHLLCELIDLESDQLARRVGHVLSSLRPDGVILTPPNCEDPTVLDALKRAQVPFVRLGSAQAGPGARVRMDDQAAARQLTEHLVELGHRRVGFVTGSARFLASRDREEGYRRALAAAGLTVDETLLVPGDFTFEGGVAAAEALLARPDRPTAILAGNDETALAVMHVARRLGVAIPDDLSLATFDDTPSVRLSLPPLTTIRQPVAEMAAQAVDLLVAAAAKDGKLSRVDHLLPFELALRASTAPPP